MKSKIAFLNITIILSSCSSYNNNGKTFYDNRNSKEIITDRLLDAAITNGQDYATKEIEQKESNSIQNEKWDKEELKKVLNLKPDQIKKIDNIYLYYNNKNAEIANSLSIDDFEKFQKNQILNKKRDEEILKILDEFQTQIYLNVKAQK